VKLSPIFAVVSFAYWLGAYLVPDGSLSFFVAIPFALLGSIAQLPTDGKRYAEFNWGGMLFAFRGVVYDETEIALPSGHQSAAWKRRMRKADLTCGGDGPIDARPWNGRGTPP